MQGHPAKISPISKMNYDNPSLLSLLRPHCSVPAGIGCRRRRRLIPWLTAFAAAILACPWSFSQTASSPTPNSSDDSTNIQHLPKFSVSATGDRGYNSANSVGSTLVNTPILDTPMSIDVLNSQFIQDTASINPIYAAQWISGVAPASNPPGTGQIVIRGQNLGGSSYMRDGVYDPSVPEGTGITLQDTALEERVEVIKGPEGTIYGSVSGYGGLINIVTKAPQSVAAFSFKGSYGADEYGGTIYRGTFDATGPITDKLDYRIVVVGQEGKSITGFLDNTAIISPMLTYHFGGGGSLLLRYEYQNPNQSTFGGWLTDVSGGYSTFISPKVSFDDYNREDQRNHDVDVDFKQPFATGPVEWVGRFYLRYSNSNEQRALEQPGASVAFLNSAGQVIGNNNTLSFNNPLLATIESLNSTVVQTYTDDRSLNSNVQLAGNIETDFLKDTIVIFGQDYRDHGAEIIDQALNYPGVVVWSSVGLPTVHQTNPLAVIAGLPEHVTTSLQPTTSIDAVGIQNVVSLFNQRVNIVAGIREDHQNATSYNFVANTSIQGDERAGTTHKVGIVLAPIEAIHLFYNNSQTFTPNGFTTDANGISYKLPNLLSTINEEGAKLSLFHDTLVLTTSYFKTVTDNATVTVGAYNNLGGPVAIQVPAGTQVVKGWDGDGTWSVTSNFDLLFGAGNLTSKTSTGLFSRNVPFGTEYRAYGKYTFHTGTLAGFYIGGGLRHEGARALDAADDHNLPPYSVVDAMAGYRYRHWSAQVNVYNLLNKVYAAYGISTTNVTAGNPRDAMVTLTYNY